MLNRMVWFSSVHFGLEWFGSLLSRMVRFISVLNGFVHFGSVHCSLNRFKNLLLVIFSQTWPFNLAPAPSPQVHQKATVTISRVEKHKRKLLKRFSLASAVEEMSLNGFEKLKTDSMAFFAWFVCYAAVFSEFQQRSLIITTFNF